MHDSAPTARLTRSRRARLLAVAAPLLGGAVVAGCTGSPASTAGPASSTPAGSTRAAEASGCLRPPAACDAPQVLRAAYGIQPLLDSGIDGRGETVTVLASPSNVPTGAQGPSGPPPPPTDIGQDLKAFDGMFRLPAARIQVVTTLAGSASPWLAPVNSDEVQDLEIVHVVAPAAALRVVLLPANLVASAAHATAGLLAGLRLAVSGTDVASIGWGLGEHFFTRAQAAQMHSILRGADAHHVTVVASSGDYGAFSDAYGGAPVKEVTLPAADPLVLAAGGTTLTANPLTGTYTSETAWDGQTGITQTFGASGGGFSHLYARPAYQDGVPGIGARRGVPDVAGDANQLGGAPVVTADGSKTTVVQAFGTSAAAMLWAGLMALADQYAHHGLGFVNPAIYRIARGSAYHAAFHDVTAGSNKTVGRGKLTGYDAGPGWDPVTGWGSPDAQALIPLLARSARGS
jgi:subtilase family serine protease